MNEALIKIQSELNAPKNLYNSFGKYSYRSCESILEAVKPLLLKYDAGLTITDEIVLIGDRYYVQAKAIFTKGEDIEIVTAYAREPEAKKGMDESQITGTASSYARKYALNGLFCIDDNKDADTDENRNERDARASRNEEANDPKVTEKEVKMMTDMAKEVGVSIEAILERYRVMSLADLRMKQYVTVIQDLEKTRQKNEKIEKTGGAA